MKTYKNKSFYTYMLDVKPFKIDVPAGTLDAIREKVIAFPWHECLTSAPMGPNSCIC